MLPLPVSQTAPLVLGFPAKNDQHGPTAAKLARQLTQSMQNKNGHWKLFLDQEGYYMILILQHISTFIADARCSVSTFSQTLRSYWGKIL